MDKDNLVIEACEYLINSTEFNKYLSSSKNIEVSEININKKKSKIINKNIGKYITISFDDIALLYNKNNLINLVFDSLKKIKKYLKLNKNIKTLIIGIGNKDINTDSLGYNVVDKINVIDNNYYLIYKNIYNITKIDTLNFIKCLVKYYDIKLVIIIDSLIAKNVNRLNNTIQLSSGGLISNKKEISINTLDIPVISIGAPFAIKTTSIIDDIFAYLNLKKQEDILEKLKYTKYDLLVSTKDIDFYLNNISLIISEGINKFMI